MLDHLEVLHLHHNVPKLSPLILPSHVVSAIKPNFLLGSLLRYLLVVGWQLILMILPCP